MFLPRLLDDGDALLEEEDGDAEDELAALRRARPGRGGVRRGVHRGERQPEQDAGHHQRPRQAVERKHDRDPGREEAGLLDLRG